MKLLQKAVVEEAVMVTSRVRMLSLRHAFRSGFQPFEAGANVTVHLPNGLRRPYSLCSDPTDSTRYQLGVLLEGKSRGGSAGMHDLSVGENIYVSYPANSFALREDARHHLLVAGGIGVTPILSMARALAKKKSSFEVHYYGRSIDEMAFAQELNDVCPSGTIHIHPDDEPKHGLDLKELLARAATSTHAYCCGPSGMVDAFQAEASHLPTDQVHIEQFGSAVGTGIRHGSAFELEIVNTGEVLNVGEHQTAIDVLRDREIMIDYSCEGGICGECRQELVAGDVEHRDTYLKNEDRKKSVMLCVSRAKGRMSVRLPLNSPGMEKF